MVMSSARISACLRRGEHRVDRRSPMRKLRRMGRPSATVPLTSVDRLITATVTVRIMDITADTGAVGDGAGKGFRQILFNQVASAVLRGSDHALRPHADHALG